MVVVVMIPFLFKSLIILLSRIFSNIFAKTSRRIIGRIAAHRAIWIWKLWV